MQANLFFLKTMLNRMFNMLPLRGNTFIMLLRNTIALLQSNNQNKLLRNFKTKLISSAIIICSCIAFNQLQAQANLTSPTIVAGCTANTFQLNYVTTGIAHTFTLNATINDTTFCSGIMATSNPIHVVLSGINNNVTLTNSGNDWIFTVNNTAQNQTINFDVWIDCTAIDTSIGSNTTYSMLMNFTSNINAINTQFSNAALQPFTVSNLYIPSLVAISNGVVFNASNLDSTCVITEYRNQSNIIANLNFMYDTVQQNYCEQMQFVNFAWSYNANSGYTYFNLNTAVNVAVPPNGSIFIKQCGRMDTCITNTCAYNNMFTYRCSSAIVQTAFCATCKDTLNTLFTLNNIATVNVSIIPSANTLLNRVGDFSCFNDTNPMAQWDYDFVLNPTTNGALDSMYIDLLYYGASYLTKQILTHIPAHTVTVNGINCTIDTTLLMQAASSLYPNQVTDPLVRLRIMVGQFGAGDTVRLHYSTVRCTDEDEAILLDKNKNTNHWNLETTVWQPCNKSIANPKQATSLESQSGQLNFDQKLSFFPSVTSLVGPAGGGFGEVADLVIQTTNLMNYWAGNNQIFGCDWATDTANKCDPHGIIKAKISMYAGMRLLDIDSSVYFLRAANNTIDTIRPTNFYTVLDTTQCDSGAYFFYWNLDSVLMQTLESGNFFFRVQACCPASELPNHLEVKFYLMPNPNNCFTLNYGANHNAAPAPQIIDTNFIPLSSVEHYINIMCPGCIVPGAIAANSRMERKSLGLQDSNNNGLADNGAIPITTNSAWYNTFKPLLQTNFSTYGDYVTDYVTIYFQDGDDQGGGYTYQQMWNNNAKFHFVQVSKSLPGGVTKMELVPVGVSFYVDTNTSAGPCIDCGDFNVANNWTTMAVVNLTMNDLQNYVTQVGDDFLFSFGDLANDSTYINNWHKTDSSISFPFTAIYPNQRYRLLVNYRECGTFDATNKGSALQTAKDVTHKMVISNKATFSGEKKLIHALNDNYPASEQALHAYGWCLGDSIPPYTIINDSLANLFSFWCQTNGSVHYGVSTDKYVSGSQSTRADSACGIVARITAQVATADAYMDAFPYEYKPPAMFYNQYNYFVPNVVNFSFATQQNMYKPNLVLVDTAPQTPVSTTIVNDTAIIQQSNTVQFSCFTEADILNTHSSTIAFAGDRINAKRFYYYSNTTACDVIVLQPDTCASLAITDNVNIPCLNVAACAVHDTVCNTSNNTNFPVYLITYLNTTITPFISTPIHDSICFNISMSNLANDSIASGGFLFICIPPSLQTNFNNWHFTPAQGLTIFANNNGIIQVKHQLGINQTISGMLCADMIHCLADDDTLTIYTGLDCNGYPADSAAAMLSCDLDSNEIILQDANPILKTVGKFQGNLTYTLCDTLVRDIDFIVQGGSGFIYPTQFSLTNLPPHLNIVNITIQDCNSTFNEQILNQISQGIYSIDSNQLALIGINNGGGMSTDSDGCIRVHIYLIPVCGFADTTNHIMTLSGHNYCGDPVSATDTSDAIFNWNGLSECNDCFTITKTANTTSINAYDTITYTVTVTANNGSPQSVIVSDLFPNNFTVIPPNPFPAYIVLDAQGDSTFTVQGYFTVSNGCDSTWNVAMLSNATDTITDSVCVQVNPPCFENNYEVIADSAYSSATYPNGVITNDTILLTGRFYIDADFSIINCVIITYPGSNIIVLGNATLTDSLNIYYSCTEMWKGIYLEENANIEMKNSRVYDAENGVWARQSNGVIIENSVIFNCITGVRMADTITTNNASYNNCNGHITGTEIAQISKLKSPYTGQTFTDTVMYASIYLQNVKYDIGDLTMPPNKLHDAANGLIAHNAITRIRNTEAYLIRPLSTNGNKRSAAYVAMTDTGAVICDMTVTPLTNTATATAHDSWRGVYSSSSNIAVIGNLIKNVAIAVSINNNNKLQKANIYGNRIEAGSRGISCNNNAGGAGVNIENNIINISGTSTAKGINIAETNNLQTTNYTIIANHINITNARSAIEVNNTYKTLIASNTVKVTSNIDTVTNGISLNGCKQANVNCNSIKGSNPTDTNAIGLATQVGIAASQSDNSTIQCNAVDSTAYGFYFGGSCLGTTFRGNDMYRHLHSLYLNAVAVIDTQQHAGNRWNDLNNPYNAVNQNDNTQFDLEQSLFITNPASGLVYNPTFPVNQNVWPFVNDQGWFYNDTGATFHCGNTLCRDISSNLNISPNILEAIVRDSVITSDYLTESQSINRTSAYEAFMGDSILTWSDVEYHNFVTANEHEARGMLYIVKVNFAKMNAYDFSFVEQIYLIDSTIKNIVLQLNEYDSLVLLSNVNVNIAARQNLLDILILQVENRNNLFTQRETYIANLLSEAASRLGLTTTDELPQTNDKMLYEMEIDLQTNGESVFENHLSTLFFVAAQCPYSGGNAVYKARAYLESLFDSLYWDDRNVCFNEGIYRHGNISSLLNTANIIVKPNPSNGILEIVKLKALQNNCRIKIKNAVGKNVFELLIDCKQGSQFIDVQSLANGVYTLTILSDNLNQLTQKIVILK